MDLNKPKLFFVSLLISFLLVSVMYSELQKGSQSHSSLLQTLDTEIKTTTQELEHDIFNSVDERFANEEKSLTRHGIDISHYQGNLLKQLPKSVNLEFVITKATQGADYIDPDFHNNWREIREKSLIRGAYHFYDSGADALVQAKHFTKVLKDWDNKDMAPILDIEQGSLNDSIKPAELQRDLSIYLNHIEDRFGKRPIIYTSYAFAQEYLNNETFSRYPLWLAEYTKSPPKVPDVWKSTGFKFWQKSQSYHLESEQVDFDLYHGLLSDLIK